MEDEKALEQTETLENEQAEMHGDGESENLSIIENLLKQGEEEGAETEKTEEPEQSEDSSEAQAEQSKDEAKQEQEPIISEEFAKEFTAVKPLVGKPISELAKSYAELQREFTRTRQELAELKKSQEEPPYREGEEDDDIEIDPLEDPEEYKKRVAEIAKKQAMQAIEEIEKQNRLREQAERARREFLTKLEKSLPEGIDLQVAVDKFAETLKKNGEVPKETAIFYANNPDAYIEHVTAYAHKLKENAQMKAAKVNAKKTQPQKEPASAPNPTDSDIASQLLQMNYRKEDWQ